MSLTAYTVLSEFKFDVGQAVLASDQLQGAVDGVSNSVNHAIESVKGLGVTFAYQFTGANTGILGILSSAVNASDKFTQSQLSFTQIIDSNMQHLTGSVGSLNEKMAASKAIMNDIAGDARKFGIPAAELVEMTKTLSAMLVPKGLAGTNFKGARDLSRNLLKSAPNLGIHPAEVQGQLLRSVEGSASMGDTLFRRLLTEAPEPFKAAKVKDAKGFNALDAAKRFGILNDAMAKFANNSDILTMRANTMSGVIQRVKDLFIGFSSILKPLGDAILPPLVELLNMGIKWIDTHGRKIVESMGFFLKGLLEDPKEFLLEIGQLSRLAGNFKFAAAGAGILATVMHLHEIFGVLAKLPVVGPFIAQFGALMGSLVPIIMKGVGAIPFILKEALIFLGPVFKVVAIGLLEFGAAMGAILIPLQGFGRAVDRMKLESLEWFANNASSLTDSFMSLKDSLAVFFAPIQDMIKGFEELFFMILGGTFFLDVFKSSLEIFVELMKGASGIFAELYAAFRGLVAGMFDVIFRSVENLGIIIQNLMDGNFSGLMDGTSNIFSGYMAAGAEEFSKTLTRMTTPTIGEGGVDNANVVNQTHNYDVKMQNNFKEVLQPDRIAFTIKDQLEKSSTNRTQARASGVSGRLAGAI